MEPDDRTDPTLPDSGMASGTDAGEPGEHLGPADLLPDEQRLLSELARGAGDAPGGAREEADAVVEAAEAEAPLPARGGPQDDGLNPQFSNPEHA